MRFRSSLSYAAGLSLAIITIVGLLTGSATRLLAADTTYLCKSQEVSTFDNRIHVRCTAAAPGGIVFFAVSTANSAHAARILSVLMMAHLTGRKITITYDSADTSGAGFGCAPSDCRRILAVAVEK